MSDVRAAIARLLRERGFKVTVEHSTLLEAQRGSQLALKPESAPSGVEVRMIPGAGGCAVATKFKDRWVPALVIGAQSAYQTFFQETQQAIDGALLRLDPKAAGTFAQPSLTLPDTKVPALERATAAVGRATEMVSNKADAVLSGGQRQRSPETWSGLRQVRFDGPRGSAQFDVGETEALITVAVLVDSQPGCVPPEFAERLQQFAQKLEPKLGDSAEGLVRVAVDSDDVPVLEFMYEQRQIRAKLPMRTLHVCLDCRYEKVTNPDYERMAERARRLRVVGGGGGMSLGGINPFATVGTLLAFKKLEPEYVCPQCQGLRSESFLVTFCPHCAQRHQEAVLATCSGCGFDFRSVVPATPLWQDLPEPEPVQQVAPPQYSADGRWWWNGREWTPVASNWGTDSREPDRDRLVQGRTNGGPEVAEPEPLS